LNLKLYAYNGVVPNDRLLRIVNTVMPGQAKKEFNIKKAEKEDLCCSTRKMEAKFSSETSLHFQGTTWRYFPEGRIL
jgi:hypothetical protein